MDDLISVLHRFIDEHIYNGAPGKGQSLYNEGGNPWLHNQVESFVSRKIKHGPESYWCEVCDRGLEGCSHPEPSGKRPGGDGG